MKPILVTGGAGFVGSHACKALSRAGYLPVTFDNLEHGHERAVKWGPLGRAMFAACRLHGEHQPAHLRAKHEPVDLMLALHRVRTDRRMSCEGPRLRWGLP